MRTFRRTLLDEALAARLHLFTGRVLDVGGKKVRKRGEFRPDAAPATSWEYLNLDAASEPDILAPAEAIPVPDGHFQSIMLSEVLEHLPEPKRVLAELRRVLSPGGRVVATMPFLFPVHGDPDDYQRWTPSRLRLEFAEAGLEVEEIAPMGSVAAVIFDLCWITWSAYVQRAPLVLHRFAMLPFRALKPIVARVDVRLSAVRSRATTGFIVVASRPG